MGFAHWSLCLRKMEDGAAHVGPSDSWINDMVVDWESGEPRFLKLFRDNADEIFVVDGQGVTLSRSGQLGFVL